MNTHMSAHDWPYAALAFLVAIVCLSFALHARRKKHLIDDLPTSKVAGVFVGLVELKGTAESENPFVSYLREVRCIQYQWRVEEHWRKTETETYRDKDGKTRTRTKTTSGWRTVDRGGRVGTFYLRDDSGVIRVLPKGARIEPLRVFSQQCRRQDPLYYSKGPRRSVPNSTHKRRFTEEAIPLHTPLYVVGKARERHDIVAPEIADAADVKLFLISTRSEEEVSSGYGVTYWGLGLLGIAIQMLWHFFIWQSHPAPGTLWLQYGWGWWVLYLAAWVSGWLGMTYNSLVCVRARMRRAWSTVDVELKRRATLIPGLMHVLQGLKAHERTVQEALIHLRAQQGATEPGQAGPDPQGCAAPVRAVAEAYPVLKTDTAFQKLQAELIHTEERIALARGYFNEVCTHYNTRLALWPDHMVARLGRFTPHPLIVAHNFERAQVRVNLQD